MPDVMAAHWNLLPLLHQKQRHPICSIDGPGKYLPPPILERTFDISFSHSSSVPVKTDSFRSESVARCDRTPSDHSLICFSRSDPNSALACIIFVCVPKMVQHNNHAISLRTCIGLCHFGSFKCLLICITYDSVCIFLQAFIDKFYLITFISVYLLK